MSTITRVPKEKNHQTSIDYDQDVVHYRYDDLRNFFNKEDQRVSFDFVSHIPNQDQQKIFATKLYSELNTKEDAKRAVLGIDIYKYSLYEKNQQKLIPFIFFLLLDYAISFFFQGEPFFSTRYKRNQIKESLINTGDGGFLFFQNPIDAVIFLSCFNTVLHLFNSYHLYPNLRKHIGQLTLRYVITYDDVYKIDSKFYGPGIIYNARIISKDKLNRFLIDDKTYEWFLLNTNGIENLTNVTQEDINHLCSTSDKKHSASQLFETNGTNNVQNIICQKLDKISVKDNCFDIYNVMIQVYTTFYSGKDSVAFTTTIGNMNCNGI